MTLPWVPALSKRSARHRQRDAGTLFGLVVLLLAIIAFYSLSFLWIMAREGRSYSFVAGVYWTLQTMTTLGYGDITFQSDAGRLFSILVLATGMVTLFVALPFTLIQVLYAPWLEARNAARAPRELPERTRDHVILTAHGPVEAALIQRLDQFHTPYIVLVPEVAEALALYDQGVDVMVGRLDDPNTFRRARVEQAALVATTLPDTTNSAVVLTVRACSSTVPIVATATWPASTDTLKLAGCDHVVQLGELLGGSIARRLSGQAAYTQVVGQLDDLRIGEAVATHTQLVGCTVRDLRLRDRLRLNVAAVWERGRYVIARPETRLTHDSLLLLCGSQADLDAYDREIVLDRPAPSFVLILGGGRVGRATSRHLAAAGIDHRIVEREDARVGDVDRLVIGDATDPAVLDRAGLGRADGVAITTHNDDVNAYLTLHCRRLRADVPILSRATLERNVMTLYRAGADSVLSYVPMEANAIFRTLGHRNLLLVLEGLDLFSVRVPAPLAGRTVADARLREETGCNVLALRPAGGRATPPIPTTTLDGGAELILIGDADAERRFFERYPTR